MSLKQIEAKLSECYKIYKPVLLHGTNNIEDRVELIKKFWIQKCNGIDAKQEYFLEDISMPPKTPTDGMGLSEKYRSAPGDSKNILEFTRRHARITDRTWRYFDAGCLSGKEVYKEMVLEIGNEYERKRYFVNRNMADHQGTNLNKRLGYFHACNGLFFLDNLDYKKEDDSDYRKLAHAIKNLDKEGDVNCIDDLSKHGLYTYKYDGFFSIRWLVAFTHDTEPFPHYFLEQFKPVSLDSKTPIVKKEETGNFNDVKLEMSVDSSGSIILDVIVSSKDVTNEKLTLEDRFLAPLRLLAKTVQNDVNDGWVYNNDLHEECKGETVAKIKFTLIQAFKKIIGKRAEGIINKKHGSAKKLMLPKKNIKIKRTK